MYTQNSFVELKFNRKNFTACYLHEDGIHKKKQKQRKKNIKPLNNTEPWPDWGQVM